MSIFLSRLEQMDLMLSTREKNSADDVLKCFLIFFQETVFDNLCKLSSIKAIYMKCHIMSSWGKNKKKVTDVSSAELAQKVVKVNVKTHTIFGGVCNPLTALINR